MSSLDEEPQLITADIDSAIQNAIGLRSRRRAHAYDNIKQRVADRIDNPRSAGRITVINCKNDENHLLNKLERQANNGDQFLLPINDPVKGTQAVAHTLMFSCRNATSRGIHGNAEPMVTPSLSGITEEEYRTHTYKVVGAAQMDTASNIDNQMAVLNTGATTIACKTRDDHIFVGETVSWTLPEAIQDPVTKNAQPKMVDAGNAPCNFTPYLQSRKYGTHGDGSFLSTFIKMVNGTHPYHEKNNVWAAMRELSHLLLVANALPTCVGVISKWAVKDQSDFQDTIREVQAKWTCPADDVTSAAGLANFFFKTLQQFTYGIVDGAWMRAQIQDTMEMYFKIQEEVEGTQFKVKSMFESTERDLGPACRFVFTTIIPVLMMYLQDRHHSSISERTIGVALSSTKRGGNLDINLKTI